MSPCATDSDSRSAWDGLDEGAAREPETPFDRLRLAVGDDGLKRLSNARVMVLGLGGVGSSCAEALARGGVGSLVLIDRDVVSPSNVNRQALAFASTIGRPKAEVMGQMVLEINPACDVVAKRLFLEKERIGEQLGAFPRPDCVVDAIDTVAQKLALAAWCQREGIPELSAMGGANKTDPCRLRFARIEETVNCPLARVMRKECRRRGIHGLRVLYSDEEPLRMRAISDEEWREKGSVLGTMSYLPPIMGQMMASRVIRDLLGWA